MTNYNELQSLTKNCWTKKPESVNWMSSFILNWLIYIQMNWDFPMLKTFLHVKQASNIQVYCIWIKQFVL